MVGPIGSDSHPRVQQQLGHGQINTTIYTKLISPEHWLYVDRVE